MKRITYKNIKLVLCIFFASSLTISCKKQLDTNPLDRFANDTFWSSETNARLAITGLYKGEIQMNSQAEFSPSDWWSYHGLLYLEFASDNAYDRRGDNSAFNKLSDGTLTNNIGILSDYWTLSYKRIARANFFLENVDKTPISPELLARFKAEARFIRACQYFYLSQYWGDAPLVTKT
ncbi:MAG: RagB/SusD family nutrient uptake outer membrane protein, partial [Sphingobacterium sp.]